MQTSLSSPLCRLRSRAIATFHRLPTTPEWLPPAGHVIRSFFLLSSSFLLTTILSLSLFVSPLSFSPYVRVCVCVCLCARVSSPVQIFDNGFPFWLRCDILKWFITANGMPYFWPPPLRQPRTSEIINYLWKRRTRFRSVGRLVYPPEKSYYNNHRVTFAFLCLDRSASHSRRRPGTARSVLLLYTTLYDSIILPVLPPCSRHPPSATRPR